VQLTPHFYDNIFLSAQALAQLVSEAMEEGQQFSDVEQMLHLTLPENKDVVRGLKIQVRRSTALARSSGHAIESLGWCVCMCCEAGLDQVQAQAVTSHLLHHLLGCWAGTV
jgi:hypothetical protein